MGLGTIEIRSSSFSMQHFFEMTRAALLTRWCCRTCGGPSRWCSSCVTPSAPTLTRASSGACSASPSSTPASVRRCRSHSESGERFRHVLLESRIPEQRMLAHTVRASHPGLSPMTPVREQKAPKASPFQAKGTVGTVSIAHIHRTFNAHQK